MADKKSICSCGDGGEIVYADARGTGFPTKDGEPNYRLYEPNQGHCRACGEPIANCFRPENMYPYLNSLNPRATVRRILVEGNRQIEIMNDGSYRIAFPNPDFVPRNKDQGKAHLAVGLAEGKTDDQIAEEANGFIFGSGVPYFHEDGTMHI
jgi:hypothetical protein